MLLYSITIALFQVCALFNVSEQHYLQVKLLTGEKGWERTRQYIIDNIHYSQSID